MTGMIGHSGKTGPSSRTEGGLGAAYMATEKSERIAQTLKIVARIVTSIRKDRGQLTVVRDVLLITHRIVDSQVTWREVLTHLQVGFYRKKRDAELRILQGPEKENFVDVHYRCDWTSNLKFLRVSPKA